MKLAILAELVKCLQKTTSINAKVEVLKANRELLPLLDRIYDPKYKFHVRSTALQGTHNEVDGVNYDSIEQLLSALHERRITGKMAVASVAKFISNNHGYAELIKLIIDKNLKARIGHGLIRRACQGDLPQTSEQIKCALGFSLSQPKTLTYLENSLILGEKWFISRKFDGIRAFLKHENGRFSLFSRRKVPISGLNPNILEALSSIVSAESFILDGELVLIDPETGRDNFSETISTVKSMEPKPLGSLKYFAFDVLHEDALFEERQRRLCEIVRELNTAFIQPVDQQPLSVYDHDSLVQRAIALGYEGFILRRNSVLKDGRSRDLLKLKPFEDAEFRIIGREIGPMRIVSDGSEKEEQVLLSLTVDCKGFPVRVGSGFSVSQRRQLASMPENELLGSLVTIRYQSESKAKNRAESSLRFPVFKHFYGKSRTD